ncbi:Trimethylguanosine synthase [Apodemus speciosus]|uniref:Trimethylguanosine synthase n=1 Tax=Apodemus speciosus TaxID=105296 RepID=A0ABQ0EMI4_APOSI
MLLFIEDREEEDRIHCLCSRAFVDDLFPRPFLQRNLCL